MDEDILVLGKGTNKVEIDLMQPIDPEKAPKVHIPALNHIGLWIDDLDAAVETLTAQGIKFTPGGIRKGAGMLNLHWFVIGIVSLCAYLWCLTAGYNVAFIHPKSAVGVLVELVQATPEVIAANK